MNMRTLLMIAALLSPVTALADSVIADDLIGQGSLCTGFDCANAEVFGATIELKENNTRILLLDVDSENVAQSSWQLIANDSGSGGASYFAINPSAGTVNGLRLGVAATGEVMLGSGSAIDAGQVSVGAADALRRLVHIADAVAATDVLIKRQLRDPVASRQAEVDALAVQVAALEEQVTLVETELRRRRRDDDDDGWLGLGPVAPAMLGLLALLAVRRRR